MSRLTVRGATSQRDIDRLFELSNDDQFGRNEAYYKLQHYEDLEEQGRLIELPCKVGDKMYSVHSAGLSHAVIAEVDTDAFFLMLCVAEGRIGKTVFTTKEAAEAKLAEMEGAK